MATSCSNGGFGALKAIAGYCATIDDTWAKALESLPQSRQGNAIAECKHELDKMGQQVTNCSAILFNNIRWEGGVSRLEIHHTHSQMPRQCHFRVAPQDSEVSEFYILHNRAIWPIRLDPNVPNMLVLDPPENNTSSPLEISAQKICELSLKIWDGCFIATGPSICEVIPIPYTQ